MKRKSYAAVVFRMVLIAGFVFSFAFADVGVAGAAWASTPGEACIFNAPYGAIPVGVVGHVGWGFRNGTGNSWVYGATEGVPLSPYIPPGPPSTTHSWHATGTWAQMLKTFGAGVQPNWPTGPGYYIRYRCSNVAASNPSMASAQVNVGENSGYNLANDNCLTKAVNILKQYGVLNLPAVTNLELPDVYFNVWLPASFNQTQWFTTLTVGVKLVDPLNGSYLITNPVRKTRPLHVQIFDGSNNLVFDSASLSSPIQATVIPGTDKYQATFQLPGTTLPNLVWSTGGVAGAYLVKVQLDYTLRKYTPGFALISQGVGNSVPDTNLTVGDVNQDNQVNITDYNLLEQCYSDLLPPPGPCPAGQKLGSDLNGDGHVNGIDYNIMLRIFQSQGGA
jgi:Dockerin type I domain